MRGERSPSFAWPYFELDGNWISLKIEQSLICPDYVSQNGLSCTISLSKTHWPSLFNKGLLYAKIFLEYFYLKKKKSW